MLAAYYRKRAAEYDAFYADPARQADLAVLRDWLAARTAGRRVLELACGTGHWTAVAAAQAAAITATDINAEMLAIAVGRAALPNVAFVQADMWHLPPLPGAFDCGMAHLWWSHLRIDERPAFLSALAARLEPQAALLMIDEILVPHVGAPVSRRDAAGNTYQRRRLASGEVFEIVKNYPGLAELEGDIASRCDTIELLRLTHFWGISARFRA